MYYILNNNVIVNKNIYIYIYIYIYIILINIYDYNNKYLIKKSKKAPTGEQVCPTEMSLLL